MEKERKPQVQTVLTDEYKSKLLSFPIDLDENLGEFEIQGQTTERSYEDRSVYFNFSDTQGWLQAEDAIELGTVLIEEGKKALIANMVNHQLIHEIERYERYYTENRIKEVILELIDENPKNFGVNFKTFRIIPQWHQGAAPLYNENWCYDRVFCFYTFEKEFDRDLDNLFHVPVIFANYDPRVDTDKFKKDLEEFANQLYY